jgi:hypothetical protein
MRRAWLLGPALSVLAFFATPADAQRYPGGFITKNPPATTRLHAPGVWRLNDVAANIKANAWPGVPLTIDYLLAGGGGSGGTTAVSSPQEGGGGGAGGLLTGNSVSLAPGSYPIVVGPGGNGVSNTSGGNSTFNGLTAVGGGFGAGPSFLAPGGNGGSGGGTGNGFSNTPGTGTGGQGHNGGQGTTSGGAFGFGTGGGGGGASAVGTVPNGGAGTASSINGASVVYCAGGPSDAGGSGSTTPGSGGGGNGPGQGGGSGANGQNGIFIVRYLTGTATGTGGAITFSGLYTIHTFTTNGTFTIA